MTWLMGALFASCVACAGVSADRVALATSAAAIACDGVQTSYGSLDHWRGSVEANPIIRGRSTAFVAGYFLAAEVVNAAVWYFAPGPAWRAAYGGLVTGVELYAAGSSDNRYVCR